MGEERTGRPARRKVAMSRLMIHVEGETEERFVNEVLAPRLYDAGYRNVSARLLGHARQRSRRGGIRAWPAVRRDICNHLAEDAGCIATTMVDYYALPTSPPNGWPGRGDAVVAPFADKARRVEEALREDIGAAMGGGFDRRRFIPFVVMHEFEGLLFSDCSEFGKAIGKPALIPEFQAIRDRFASPEEINDSPVTAPSKRIDGLFPGYQKPLHGVVAASAIGLDLLCAECPHFAGWVDTLCGSQIR